MTVFIVFLCVILVILAFSLLKIHFEIECNDEISAKLRVLCIKFSLYPKNKKKVNINKYKKGYPKEKVKEEKPQKKEQSIKKTQDAGIDEKISVIIKLLGLLFSRFFKHLRLDVSKILITVGGDDAASTAIIYGIVSQSVAYLLEYLDSHLKISKKRKGEIDVRCDFTSENTVFDIKLSASLSVWQILDIAITLAYNYLKGKDIFNILNSQRRTNKNA